MLRDLAKSGKRIGAKAIDISNVVRTHIEDIHFDRLIEVDANLNDEFPILQQPSKRHAIPVLTDRYAMEETGTLAQSGNLFGTVFLVDGSWYARPEGMSGVLLPLTFSVLARLAVEDGSPYQIEGKLLRSSEGYPIAIEVERLKHIGPRPAV